MSKISKKFNAGTPVWTEKSIMKFLRVKTLEGQTLSNFDLDDAELSDANLKKTDLRGARLNRVNLSGSDLSKALMDKLSLNIEIKDIKGAILKGLRLETIKKGLMSKKESAVMINKILQERWGYMLDENGVVVDAPALKPNTGVHIK